jgi:two-component system phosphate regulon sensor histidine kinase PhoR
MKSPSIKRSSSVPEVELGLPWFSIRFQISLLLLLSALNGIVVVAYAVALGTSDVAVEGGGESTAARQVLAVVTPLHRELVEGRASPEDLEPQLDRLGGLLLDSPESSGAALMALSDYRGFLRAASEGLERGDASGVLASNASYHRLLGAVYLMEEELGDGGTARAGWPLGALLLWVVVVAGATVASAFRLRSVLSLPLSQLSQAAMVVAGGKLDAAIPTQGVSQEFHQLGEALETMRRELVRSIAQLDHQNVVVKAMLDALGDGVLLLDRARHVLEFNPAAARHLQGIAPPGLSRARRLPVAELLPGLDKQLFLGSSGEPVQLHYTLDGEVERYLEVSLQPLAGVGHDLDRAFVMVVRDVTRSVELDNLQRSFLSVVTHELKTPLTVIEGYVRLLQMGKGGDLSPKQADMLQKVRAQSEVLGLMVQDLLDTTRLEGGHLSLDRHDVSLAQVATKVVEAQRLEALSRRLELVLEIAEDARGPVWADELRLEQVLGNLLRNAFKFTESGGQVSVSVEREDGRMLVRVADTGRGIPEAALPHLFEKFYQVEASDTRKAGGAGLGLYICDQLVRAMDGVITVRSTVGRGSSFTVSLPVSQRAEQKEAGV